MSTGVKLHDELVQVYQAFKLSSNKNRYLVMKIESGKVILEKLSDSSSFEDFLADVHVDGAPRYAIIKLAYQSKDGRDCEKLVSITWNPDAGSVKNKMLYAGSKDALKALDGISVIVNATDASEMTQKVLIDACTKV